MTLTKEQFNNLRAKGLSTQQIIAFEQGKSPEDIKQEQARATEGFGKKLLRATTEPVVTLLARPVQLAKALGGATPEEQAIRLPFYGKIEAPTEAKDVVADIGRAAEAVSLGVGGAGAKTAVQTGLKGLIAEGVKEGATVGLKTGALTGFGQGLEVASEEEPSKAFQTVFGSTALGAGLGLASGGVFGAATPIVARGVSGLKQFTNVADLENKLSEGYRKVLNPGERALKIDKRFGGDSMKFLSQELPDLPIQVDNNGRILADDALEMARQKYTAEATAYKPIIRNSGKFIDIDNIIANAKKQARQTFDGSDLTKAEQQIENEINSFLANSPQDVNVTLSGRRFIPLDRADDIKSYSWSRGKGWGTPEAEVWNDTNNIIGHAIKDAIEKELPEAPIRAMNRRLGQWKNAIDMLERRNGAVSGSGGKLAKYIIRATGTSIGAGLGDDTTGRLTGAGAGFLTAQTLATIMANPSVRLFVVRQLIKNLQKAGRQDMIKEAQDILSEQASRYLLPGAGESSFVPPQSVINLPRSAREATLGLDELRGANINRTRTQVPKTAPQQAISVVDDPLAQEARKYKSVEEFVKNRDGTLTKAETGKSLTVKLYHGTPDARFAEEFNPTQKGYYPNDPNALPNNTEFNKLYGGTGKGFAKESPTGNVGISLTDNKLTAKSYADKPAFDYQNSVPMVLERYVTLKNPKVYDLKGKTWDLNMEQVMRQAMNEGHDGLVFKNIRDNYHPSDAKYSANNVIVFDPKNVMSQSQLTDIWERANKKK